MTDSAPPCSSGATRSREGPAHALRQRVHRGPELKWWVMVLVFYYGLPIRYCADIFEVHQRTIEHWHKRFQDTGSISRKERVHRPRWPTYVVAHVKELLLENPGMYIDELQHNIVKNFPLVRNVSHSTILRVLHNDLGFTRTVMVRRANEARKEDITRYAEELSHWYYYPEQLIFVDETSKDARSSYRARGWSKMGSPAFATQTFERGTRISVLASLGVHGFIDWCMTADTFTRDAFHHAFIECVLPHLCPWPGPRSIVVLDNASIHRYPELADVCAIVGAKLVYLPPYTPQLNPIECGFNLMKSWLLRHISPELWKVDARACIDAAMACCSSYANVGLPMFAYCGYEVHGVLLRLISRRMRTRVTSRFPWMRGLTGVTEAVSRDHDYTAGTNLTVDLGEEDYFSDHSSDSSSSNSGRGNKRQRT